MLYNKFKNKNIILASGSPRRQELFKELGVNYSIKVKEVDEIYDSTLKKEEITNYLAELKANAFSNEIGNNDIIITADTIVWQNNKALEKPKNKLEAIKMLQQLSGTKHSVFSSICIKNKYLQKVFYDETIVYFKKLSEQELVYYVENYKPFDKAGAYGIQDWIGYIGITNIEGTYNNVMGLPTHLLYKELMNL